MSKKSELAVIDLDAIDVNKLPELANFKERGQQLVKECVFVEIKDNATYELAKKNRTALRTFRTDVEKSDKAIKAKLNNFKNRVGEVSASLIAITEPSEKTQQAEVERYEQIKENERLEKLRLEQERVDNIKKSIGEFRQYWEDKFSILTFDTIESLRTNFKAVLNQHNRSIYQEFEVLFEDSAVYLNNLLEARIKTLTEQEEIRVIQIELAKEKERQRLESERIAEEQRKERERIKAEQKAEAEKIRIAKEQFEREKREFEKKQAEARFQERKKRLIEIGLVDDEKERLVFEDSEFRYSQIRDFEDNVFEESVRFFVEKIANHVVYNESTIQTQEAEFEQTESDQSANEKEAEVLVFENLEEIKETSEENLKKETIGHSTRLKANTPMPEKELTWKSIYSLFQDQTQLKKDLNIQDFYEWLDNNYNVPTPKI